MITHSEYMILHSTLRPTIKPQEAYYVDPRRWLSWGTVIELLQDSGYLEYELTDNGMDYGYKVTYLAYHALKEYRISSTYKPSSVFERFIENELDIS